MHLFHLFIVGGTHDFRVECLFHLWWNVQLLNLLRGVRFLVHLTEEGVEKTLLLRWWGGVQISLNIHQFFATLHAVEKILLLRVVQRRLVESVVQGCDVFDFDFNLGHLRRVRRRVELGLEFLLDVLRDVRRRQLGGRLNLLRLNHRDGIFFFVRTQLCHQIFHHVDVHARFVDRL